jgi:hypothetical protein
VLLVPFSALPGNTDRLKVPQPIHEGREKVKEKNETRINKKSKKKGGAHKMATGDQLERLNTELDEALVSYFDLFTEYQTLHADLGNRLKNVRPSPPRRDA